MDPRDDAAFLEISVAPAGERYLCSTRESLLRGMAKLGRKGIPVGCLSGGCGVCKVRILEGTVRPTGPISGAHVSPEDAGAGLTLACRVAPLTAVHLEIAGKLQKSFS